MFKKINATRIIIYFSVLFFIFTSIYFSVIANKIASQSQENLTTYYIDLAYGSIKKAALWSAVFILLALMIHLVSFLIILLRNQKTQKSILVYHTFRKILSKFLAESKTALKFALPTLLSLFLLILTLGRTNFLNKTRLKDDFVAEWDFFLTGNYPFLSLSNIHYPKWLIYLVEFSFSYLIFFLIIFSFYIFYKNVRVFKELAVAFSLGLILMFISWLVVPVLSPHDRYIDNVYDLPVPTKISQALTEYAPQEEITSFLEKARARKENLKTFPTSTFPSAHVFWAVLFGYYLYRTNKKVAMTFAPILGLSSFGTFFFAQHYFVDAPAGIFFAAITIVLVHCLLRRA